MNLVNGRIVNENELSSEIINNIKFQSPVSHFVLFNALELIVKDLKNKKAIYEELLHILIHEDQLNMDDSIETLNYLIDFISIDNLRLKLKREFKTEYPFELKRISMKSDEFEGYFPLGILFHITPNNSPLLSTLALVEGLLSGNVNILKLGSKDSSFSLKFFEYLCGLAENENLKNFIHILKISSKNKVVLQSVFNKANVVSAWGSEESIEEIRKMINPGTRLIEWGHKISFIYKTKDKIAESDEYEKIAFEILNNEQLACSSPQMIFLEDETFEGLIAFGKKLEKSLIKLSKNKKRIRPQGQECAEITIAKELVRLESAFDNAHLIDNVENGFRIFIDNKVGLSTSPLYGSIWIRSIKSENLFEVLSPLKKYLQTVGILCQQSDLNEILEKLFSVGVQRIRAVGEMTSSYTGEPHDGEYAITRFCQKISFSNNNLTKGLYCIDKANVEKKIISAPIMTKSDFQNMKIENQYCDLFFQSGGSTGTPKLSMFTYDDYHRQMELAAEGLYAAGLDPKIDRCMNLFYAGNLYGGFVSFFTILEKMEAKHFPMAGSGDFGGIANTIVQNQVNTLLGMPSLIMQLFKSNQELLKKNKFVKKIFFGGEHMSLAQKKFLMEEFGVEIIRSASYGSVDAGPLGFQCEFSEGSIHHLHEKLHSLEVVSLEADKLVSEGDVGRFLFTSKVRHGQNINRYEIGDVGRIVNGKCKCGRSGIRFELLGRCGDVFRIGTIFLSYQKIQKVLIDQLEYDGMIQVVLRSDSENSDQLLVYLENNCLESSVENVKELLINNYSELKEVVINDKVLSIELIFVNADQFVFNEKTKKLKTVVDKRIIE